MSKPSVLIINGSLRETSSTSVIIQELMTLLSDSATFVLYNELGTLPHFNDPPVVPVPVGAFRKLLQNASGVIICTPEYAFGIPGSLKNALDWTVSSGEFDGKPVAVLTAATSGEMAHQSIQNVLKALSAKVDATLLINFIRSRIREDRLVDIDSKAQLKAFAEKFVGLLL